MKELAKECLEVHSNIMPLFKARQEKGDKIASLIRAELIKILGDDYQEINVYAEFFQECIYFLVMLEEDQLCIFPPKEDKRWHLDVGSRWDGMPMCRDKKMIKAAQSIVDKLNGKE